MAARHRRVPSGRAGLPPATRLYPGYWDNLARCCGTAGVGQLLLDRYQATGDTALLDWAGTLAADVAGRAVTTPKASPGPTPNTPRPRRNCPRTTGFMQGAAGIAGWLARLHALHTRPGPPALVPRPGPPWA